MASEASASAGRAAEAAARSSASSASLCFILGGLGVFWGLGFGV